MRTHQLIGNNVPINIAFACEIVRPLLRHIHCIGHCIVDPMNRCEIEAIAGATVGQRTNPLWLRMREKRLTASAFGKAIGAARRGNPANIIRFRQNLLKPRDISYIPAVRWGVDHEKIAIAEYERKSGNKVRETGLWLYPDGYLAASPDGLIYEDGKLVGILEVKCPYSLHSIQLRCPGDFCTRLSYLKEPPCLKPNSHYYHQIQGQLFATGAAWCDFLVWAPSNTLLIRVDPDPSWRATILPQLRNFYNAWILPPEQQTIELTIPAPIQSMLHPSNPTEVRLQAHVVNALTLVLGRWINNVREVPVDFECKWRRAKEQVCYNCAKKYCAANLEAELKNTDLLTLLLLPSTDWAPLLNSLTHLIRPHLEGSALSASFYDPPCNCSQQHE